MTWERTLFVIYQWDGFSLVNISICETSDILDLKAKQIFMSIRKTETLKIFRHHVQEVNRSRLFSSIKVGLLWSINITRRLKMFWIIPSKRRAGYRLQISTEVIPVLDSMATRRRGEDTTRGNTRLRHLKFHYRAQAGHEFLKGPKLWEGRSTSLQLSVALD